MNSFSVHFFLLSSFLLQQVWISFQFIFFLVSLQNLSFLFFAKCKFSFQFIFFRFLIAFSVSGVFECGFVLVNHRRHRETSSWDMFVFHRHPTQSSSFQREGDRNRCSRAEDAFWNHDPGLWSTLWTYSCMVGSWSKWSLSFISRFKIIIVSIMTKSDIIRQTCCLINVRRRQHYSPAFMIFLHNNSFTFRLALAIFC